MNNFKRVLKNYSLPGTLKQIPQDTLNLVDGVQLAKILKVYCPSGWVKRITMEILEKINCADLAELVMKQLEDKKKPFHTVF